MHCLNATRIVAFRHAGLPHSSWRPLKAMPATIAAPALHHPIRFHLTQRSSHDAAHVGHADPAVYLAVTVLAVALAVAAKPSEQANLWLAQPGGMPTGQTWQRDRSGAWTQVAAHTAPLLQVGREQWRIEQKPRKIPYFSCDCLFAARAQVDAAPVGHCQRLAYHMVPQAVSLRTGQKVTLIALPASVSMGEEPGPFTFEILGAVGPYVLTASHATDDGCGAAHDHLDSALQVTDLRTGRAVEPWTRRETARLVKALASQGLSKVRQNVPESEMLDWPGDAAFLHALRPTWQHGKLLWQLLMSIDWDYADGDGVWGDATRSAWLSTRAMPQRFAPYARLPAELATLVDQVPGVIAVSTTR